MDKMITLIIGNSDLNADWLKYLDDGRHRIADLRAHDEALQMYLDSIDEVSEVDDDSGESELDAS
jgi:hypothetical protein